MIPEAVCRETSVEFEEALFSEGLDCTVDWALVGVCSICQLVHFLNAGFDKVEGQTAGCCTEASNQGSSQNSYLATLGKASFFYQLFRLQHINKGIVCVLFSSCVTLLSHIGKVTCVALQYVNGAKDTCMQSVTVLADSL